MQVIKYIFHVFNAKTEEIKRKACALAYGVLDENYKVF